MTTYLHLLNALFKYFRYSTRVKFLLVVMQVLNILKLNSTSLKECELQVLVTLCYKGIIRYSLKKTQVVVLQRYYYSMRIENHKIVQWKY